jgi:hypothetical protein
VSKSYKDHQCPFRARMGLVGDLCELEDKVHLRLHLQHKPFRQRL